MCGVQKLWNSPIDPDFRVQTAAVQGAVLRACLSVAMGVVVEFVGPIWLQKLLMRVRKPCGALIKYKCRM